MIDPERVRDAADSAVRHFLSELGNDFSTGKFVLVVESLDENGDRGVWVGTAQDQTPWDTMGLLDYALSLEQESIDP